MSLNKRLISQKLAVYPIRNVCRKEICLRNDFMVQVNANRLCWPIRDNTAVRRLAYAMTSMVQVNVSGLQCYIMLPH